MFTFLKYFFIFLIFIFLIFILKKQYKNTDIIVQLQNLKIDVLLKKYGWILEFLLRLVFIFYLIRYSIDSTNYAKNILYTYIQRPFLFFTFLNFQNLLVVILFIIIDMPIKYLLFNIFQNFVADDLRLFLFLVQSITVTYDTLLLIYSSFKNLFKKYY